VICTIIPCCNEAKNIKKVLRSVSKSNTDKILVVDNGSYDGTTQIVKKYPSDKIELLSFNIPLGHDIPKSIGLFYSLMDNYDHFLFIDGDMIGITSNNINDMIRSLKSGVDLSLTDCYYKGDMPTGLPQYILNFRKMLNTQLNIFKKVKYSTPSHGPHGISKELASSIPIEYICVPPLLLTYAAKNSYLIDIGLKKLHKDMVKEKDDGEHTLNMAETLIGDFICGMREAKNKPLGRKFDGIEFIGYHKYRRFDVLGLVTGHSMIDKSIL
jgi:glycosyltransferase involved in cell wall biosynthesis